MPLPSYPTKICAWRGRKGRKADLEQNPAANAGLAGEPVRDSFSGCPPFFFQTRLSLTHDRFHVWLWAQESWAFSRCVCVCVCAWMCVCVCVCVCRAETYNVLCPHQVPLLHAGCTLELLNTV